MTRKKLLFARKFHAADVFGRPFRMRVYREVYFKVSRSDPDPSLSFCNNLTKEF